MRTLGRQTRPDARTGRCLLACEAKWMDHRELLERAIALSSQGIREGAGGPFGAVVARAGEIVGEGWNRVTSSFDPTAHAEIVAIRTAARALGRFSLEGCVLYSSCEPCPMCLAATYWSRIEQVYFANTRNDAAAIGFDDRLFHEEFQRPAEERSLSLSRIELEGALEPMRCWQEDPKRRQY